MSVKEKILVVDDQPSIRRLLEEILTDEGYAVTAASNGLEALERIEEDTALVLMDMKMPGMDGIETLKELNSSGHRGKVVMMTAYGELDLVQQAKEFGAFDYVIKPFDIVALCELIAAFIKTRRTERAANEIIAADKK